jgi:signal transduction histidine kinase
VAAVALGLAGGAVLVAIDAAPDGRADRAIQQALIICMPVVAGLFAMRTPRTARFGLALTAAGLVWSLTALANTSDSLSYSIGRVSAWLVFPFLLYLILIYPEGRLRPGLNRTLYVTSLLLLTLLFIGSALFVEAYPINTPWAVCRHDCPDNAFLVLDHEPALMADVVTPARELMTAAVMAAIVGWLVSRLATATRRTRQQITPVVVAGIGSCATLIAYLLARRFDTHDETIETLGRVWSLWIPAIAVAFLIGLVVRRMMLARTLERLSLAFAHELEPRELRAAIADALDDPGADVLLPDGAPGRWRNADDVAVSASTAAGPRHQVTTIADGATPVAALVHDRALGEDEELLHAVSSLMLFALRHSLVLKRLAGSLHQLEESRSRLLRAADVERSRIERDLHDGAQQRLIMLRVKLTLAEELLRSDPAAGRAAVAGLGSEIERALDDLRTLGHGVYPAVLNDRGLGDALRSVVAGAPLPVHLQTHGLSRLPQEVEVAIYFTCLEAVQNAEKHAHGATGVWITLRQTDRLMFEVRDDGKGFAHAESNGGLRNMADRVEAVGGRLVIDSAPGHGTRVLATLPLAVPDHTS